MAGKGKPVEPSEELQKQYEQRTKRPPPAPSVNPTQETLDEILAVVKKILQIVKKQ